MVGVDKTEIELLQLVIAPVRVLHRPDAGIGAVYCLSLAMAASRPLRPARTRLMPSGLRVTATVPVPIASRAAKSRGLASRTTVFTGWSVSCRRVAIGEGLYSIMLQGPCAAQAAKIAVSRSACDAVRATAIFQGSSHPFQQILLLGADGVAMLGRALQSLQQGKISPLRAMNRRHIPVDRDFGETGLHQQSRNRVRPRPLGKIDGR